MRTIRLLTRLPLTALTLTGAGCASVEATRTGHLADYSGLRDTGEWLTRTGGRVSTLAGPTARLSVPFDSVYIDPIVWQVPEDGAIDAERRADLLAAAHAALCAELAESVTLTDRPGPRTARVRLAITRVTLSRPVANLALTAVLGPLINGGASAEAEVLAPDGRRLLALSTSSAGGPLELFGFYARNRHAENAFRRVGREIRVRLFEQPRDAR